MGRRRGGHPHSGVLLVAAVVGGGRSRRVLMEAVVDGGRGRRVLMGLARPEDGVLMMSI